MGMKRVWEENGKMKECDVIFTLVYIYVLNSGLLNVKLTYVYIEKIC